jgi:capsular exopolysaccharide synthesis family protein
MTDSGQAGFARYWRVLREHLKLVVACVLVAGLAAAAYTHVATRKYQAQAQLLISPIDATNSFTVGLPVLHSSADPTRDALTAASLITTPQVADAVNSALHLHQPSGQLLGAVTATPLGQSSLISVQATSTSALEAQQIANQFTRQVIRLRTAALHAVLAQEIPGLSAQLAAETPAQRNGNGTLAAELSQLELLARSPDPTIALAATAGLPPAPYTPRTKLVIAAGLLAGLLIGIGAAFLFDTLDPRLRREEQLRDIFDLRTLVRVPIVKRLGLRRRRRSAPMLPTQLNPAGVEAYRRLRLVLTVASRGSQAFLVTSSDPSEGKTTSAINLAASIAKGGKSVVLIEADLRRPTISRLLSLNVKHGTEHVAFGRNKLSNALISTQIDKAKVRVLAVQSPRPLLAAKLSFDIAQRLITEAKELADFVVIDSPPIAAVADALPLAEFSDEVIVVARLGVSRLSKLAELRDLLHDQGSPPSGLVLIGGNPPRGAYEYNYGPSETQAGLSAAPDSVRLQRPTRAPAAD